MGEGGDGRIGRLVSYLPVYRPPLSALIDVHLARNDRTLFTASVLLQELDRVLMHPRLHRRMGG